MEKPQRKPRKLRIIKTIPDLTEENIEQVYQDNFKKIDLDDNDYNKLKGSIEGLHTTPRSLHVDPSKNSYENYSPSRAQRETFKLINSVKALQNTMTELVPNLSAAKKVLDLYKVIKH